MDGTDPSRSISPRALHERLGTAQAAILIRQSGRIGAGAAPGAFGVSALLAISAIARTRFLA